MTQITIGTMDAYLAEPGTEGRHSGVILAPRHTYPEEDDRRSQVEVHDRCVLRRGTRDGAVWSGDYTER